MKTKIIFLVVLLNIALSYSWNTLDSLLTFSDTLRVLAITAHPDDEVGWLGMASTKMLYENERATRSTMAVLTLTDGRLEPCAYTKDSSGAIKVISRGCPCDTSMKDSSAYFCPYKMGAFRLSRMKEAKNILGMDNYYFPMDVFLKYRPYSHGVDSIKKWIKLYKPTVLITHNLQGDYQVNGVNKQEHANVSKLVTDAVNQLTMLDKPKYFYYFVHNVKDIYGRYLQAPATGSPKATDSITNQYYYGDLLWDNTYIASQKYDGSYYYMDYGRVAPSYKHNLFYRVY